MFEGLPQNKQETEKEIEEVLEVLPSTEEIQSSLQEGLDSKSFEEEIESVFKQLTGGKEYEEVQKNEDEKGLFIWEIGIPLDEGGRVEYMYMRKDGINPEDEALPTSIQATIFDKEGSVVSEHQAAVQIDGGWQLKSLNS